MGFGLRFREKVKQVGKKSSQPDKHGFVPTNFDRVQLTYDEAVAFAESLKVIRKRISDAQAARTKMFKDIETTLTGSLPKIHEIDPVTGDHTTAEAAAEEHSGDYVHTGTLTRLIEENDTKVQTQVFAPIDKWISEVDLFKGKVKILENLRLELDGSRRDHITIENKIAKQEAKAQEVDTKHTSHIQSKDASVAGKRTAFEQYEAQLYEELVNVIGESGVLHTVLDRAIKLEMEVLDRARDPIASSTARLEQLSATSGSPLTSPHTSNYGANTPTGTSVAGGYAPSTGGYPQSTGAGGYGQPTGGYGQSAGTGGYGQTTGTGPSHANVIHSSELPSVPKSAGTGPAATATTTAPTSGANNPPPAYERPYAS